MSEPIDAFPPPHQRANQIGHGEIESKLRAAMTEGVLSHGWIIAGPKGAGKATLAYRIARGLLDPAALVDAHSFQVSDSEQRSSRSFCRPARVGREKNQVSV